MIYIKGLFQLLIDHPVIAYILFCIFSGVILIDWCASLERRLRENKE